MAGQPPTINEEAGLGPNWIPLDGPPIIPGQTISAPPVSDFSPTNPKYIQGSIAPNFQHDSSFVDTGDKTAYVPKFDLMPLGLQQNAISSAQVSSTSSIIVKQAIAAIPPAPVATPVTDGLIHGTLPWESDPSYVAWRDDFFFAPNNLIDSGSPNVIGELNWNVLLSSGVVNSANLGYTQFGTINPGVIELYTNATTANSFANIIPFSSQGQAPLSGNWFNSALPLLDYPGWKCTWIFGVRPPLNATNLNLLDAGHRSLYIGLGIAFPASSFQTRPPVFLGCRFDTDTSAPSINDTTFILEAVLNGCPTAANSRFNTQGQTFDTGIGPVAGQNTFYRLDISSQAANQVTISLNGVGKTFTLTQRNDAYTHNGLMASGAGGTLSVGLSPVTPSVTDGAPTFAAGSKVLLSGITGTGNVGNANGTWVALANSGAVGVFPIPGISGNNGPNPFTAFYYPALIPFAFCGNDSTGGGAANSFALMIDFFSFIWNPGVISPTAATPNSSKARYF